MSGGPRRSDSSLGSLHSERKYQADIDCLARVDRLGVDRGKHNVRDLTVAAAMTSLITQLVGKRLSYRDLTGTTAAAKLAKAAQIEKANKKRWPTMAENEQDAECNGSLSKLGPRPVQRCTFSGTADG